jgi:hypothetical protein
MTVTFDEASGRWRVVTRDGAVIEDGFASNAAPWRWLDQHDEDEIADDATRVRIGNGDVYDRLTKTRPDALATGSVARGCAVSRRQVIANSGSESTSTPIAIAG